MTVPIKIRCEATSDGSGLTYMKKDSNMIGDHWMQDPGGSGYRKIRPAFRNPIHMLRQ